jgi:hypothetical protein
MNSHSFLLLFFLFPFTYSRWYDSTKYVTFSASSTSSARHMDYLFLAPFAARAWIRMGYNVLFVLITSPNPTLLQQQMEEIVLQELKSLPSTQIFTIPTQASTSITLSQVIRLFVPLLPCSPSQGWLWTSDVDIIPLNEKSFAVIANTDQIELYNGMCCRGEYPITSIGMAIPLWRSLFLPFLNLSLPKISLISTTQKYQKTSNHLSCNPSPNSLTTSDISHLLLESLHNHFGYTKQHISHGATFWNMDQQLATTTINAYRSRHTRDPLIFLPGPAASGRYHLDDGIPTHEMAKRSDAHLAGFLANRDYPKLRQLFVRMGVRIEELIEMDSYTKRWLSLSKSLPQKPKF